MKTLLKMRFLKNRNYFSEETQEGKLNYFTAVTGELIYYPLGWFD